MNEWAKIYQADANKQKQKKMYICILGTRTESKTKIIKHKDAYFQWCSGAGMCWPMRTNCVHLIPALSSVTLHH